MAHQWSAVGGPARLGVVGLGQAGLVTLDRALARPDDFIVVAGVDPAPEAAAEAERMGVEVVPDLPALDVAGVDALYIASPTHWHERHASWALDHGLSVLVEKPLAASVAECDRLVAQAARTGQVAMVAHKRSLDPGIRTMSELLRTGGLGPARLVTMLHANDWMLRPRRPDELSSATGGGVVYRQGSHHFDMLRALMVEPSVVAGRVWQDGRTGSDVGFVALLADQVGGIASVTVSGAGRLDSREFTFGLGANGSVSAAPGAQDGRDVLTSKRDRAATIRSVSRLGPGVSSSSMFGLTLVECEGASMRQTRDGILVVHAGGDSEIIELVVAGDGLEGVLDEFVAAIRGAQAPTRDFAYGRAVLSMCVSVAGEPADSASRSAPASG